MPHKSGLYQNDLVLTCATSRNLSNVVDRKDSEGKNRLRILNFIVQEVRTPIIPLPVHVICNVCIGSPGPYLPE